LCLPRLCVVCGRCHPTSFPFLPSRFRPRGRASLLLIPFWLWGSRPRGNRRSSVLVDGSSGRSGRRREDAREGPSARVFREEGGGPRLSPLFPSSPRRRPSPLLPLADGSLPLVLSTEPRSAPARAFADSGHEGSEGQSGGGPARAFGPGLASMGRRPRRFGRFGVFREKSYTFGNDFLLLHLVLLARASPLQKLTPALLLAFVSKDFALLRLPCRCSCRCFLSLRLAFRKLLVVFSIAEAR